MAESSRGRAVELPDEVRAVNIGLGVFGEAVREQGGQAVDVDWRIPAGGDPELVGALTRLFGSRTDAIDQANREVVRRLDTSAPALVGIGSAADHLRGMGERMVLHPGPPLRWEEFCDPLRRSVRAAVMAEGWAGTPDDAQALVDRGGVELEPANHHGASIPMASAIGPSAPVLIVDDDEGGRRAYSGVNQGPGQTAWFGVDAGEAVDRLTFLRDVAAPILNAAIRAADPIDVFSFAAQGLQMGDDAHMRTQAATNVLIRHLLPHLAAQDDPRRVDVARFLAGNHLFFLNVVMAAAKAATDWAAEVQEASIVTGMARNGTTFGIRVGTIGEWFVAPAPPVEDALYHADYGPDDGAPDIGDSAILELTGLGGAAAAASPAVAAFVGGRMNDALARTQLMRRICAGESSRFKLPFLDYRGAPLGVDLRRVVEQDITPAINTGILHRSDGLGQVGAGVARAPIDSFREALLALDRASA
ncbi:MAG: DUF1116 domain-containing protein [Actinomycetota bacterium]